MSHHRTRPRRRGGQLPTALPERTRPRIFTTPRHLSAAPNLRPRGTRRDGAFTNPEGAGVKDTSGFRTHPSAAVRGITELLINKPLAESNAMHVRSYERDYAI